LSFRLVYSDLIVFEMGHSRPDINDILAQMFEAQTKLLSGSEEISI